MIRHCFWVWRGLWSAVMWWPIRLQIVRRSLGGTWTRTDRIGWIWGKEALSNGHAEYVPGVLEREDWPS